MRHDEAIERKIIVYDMRIWK